MEKQEEWERKSETVCAEEELTPRELREEILRLRRSWMMSVRRRNFLSVQ